MNSKNNAVPEIAVKAVIIYAIYKLVGEPLLEGLNLNKTDAEEAEEKANEEYGGGGGKPISQNPWSPQYVELLKQANASPDVSIKLLTVSTLNTMARTIWDAKGSWNSSLPFFDDNEDAVYGVFRTMVAKSQLSQFAGRFQLLYNRDLYEYINGFMNSSEMAKVNNIVKGYLTGIIKNGKLS